VANNTSTSANYFASEIHSPLRIDQDDTFNLTMSTSADVGKKPSVSYPAPNTVNGGSAAVKARPGGTGLITIEPPRQSDLQVGAPHLGACC
jgi:hypothetical protein